jgi:hypothetical protein
MDLHFTPRLLIAAIALTWVLAPMLQHWMKARPSAAGTGHGKHSAIKNGLAFPRLPDNRTCHERKKTDENDPVQKVYAAPFPASFVSAPEAGF